MSSCIYRKVEEKEAVEMSYCKVGVRVCVCVWGGGGRGREGGGWVGLLTESVSIRETGSVGKEIQNGNEAVGGLCV